MLRRLLVCSIAAGLALPAIASSNSEEKAPQPLMLKEGRDSEIRELATYQLKRRFFPMASSSATTLKEGFEERDAMINKSVREPDQQSRTLVINPSVVSGKPTVFASANYLTTLVFVDNYGNPWDIEDIGVGAGSYFEYKTVNPYTIWLFPKKKYKKSNLSVLLKGLVTPIVLNLEESPDKVDYAVQAKIIGVGSNTEVNEFSYTPLEVDLTNGSIMADSTILQMADGITPKEVNRLVVEINGSETSEIQAWEYLDNYYVRLKGDVVSPHPEQAASPSVDGKKLYKIPRISSLFIEKDGLLITGVMLKRKNK
jgi:hypothetical protein